ncbi:MAG TPA: hypothetical protein DEO60_12885 [Bacteroidales bacterium]|nr:hypothetical protein [Bacteroidales bacterium]
MFAYNMNFLMRESIIRRYLVLVPFLMVAFGCAKMNTPSGGPKDKTIPVIVKSIPENGATGFKGREILVTFDEYVVLEKIAEKFMVSPPMKKKPEVVVRGKSIRIRYEDELRDSTTYTFYFQDAIRDLNENNPINNYQFVFSTGPFIDSLSVTGNVYSALNLDPPENTLVLLYSQLNDSAVVKQIPDYITRAESNGEFRIDNVHPGTYRLYALSDADNSKNYNNSDELFAFYTEPIIVTPEKNFLPVKKDSVTVTIKPAAAGKVIVKPPVKGEYPLILFSAEKRLHYLTSSSRKQPYQLFYALSLPPDSLKFEFAIPGVAPDAWFIEKSRNRDSITVWLTDSTVYNRQEIETIVRYPFTDTLGITAMKYDTIQMRYQAPRAVRTKIVKRTPYKVSTGITSQERPDKKITFTAQSPLLPPDTSKLILYELVKEQRVRHPFTLSRDTSYASRYHLKTELLPGKSYLFITDSAAFSSIYGDYSDSAGIRFSVMPAESYGKLILDLSGFKGGKIIQLLDSQEKLVRQVYQRDTIKLEFPLLEKGKYRVRAIFDLNNDGKWTTGDFNQHRQPEPVSYYPGEIEIKENWEIVNPWKLSQENYKESKLQIVKTSVR